MIFRTLCSAIICCISLGLVAGDANAQQVYELKASVFTPASNPLAKAMEQWATHLKEQSAGRLDIKIFPGSQMGPPPRQFDLARSGVADISIILHGLTPGQFPLVELSHLPGVLTTGYASSLALSEVWTALPKSDHPGVKVLNVLAIVPMPLISKVQYTTPADLKGRRIRAAGSVQSDVLDALGAVPTLVQPGDLNDALSKGMIEGASVGYSGIASYHLADEAKFIAEGDLGGVTFATVMNQGAYEKLPEDLKRLIDESSGVAGAQLFGRVLADDENSYRSQLIAAGLKLTTLSDDIVLQQAGKTITAKALARADSAGYDGEDTLARIRTAVRKYQGQQ